MFSRSGGSQRAMLESREWPGRVVETPLAPLLQRQDRLVTTAAPNSRL
jgi:hypothetical protein